MKTKENRKAQMEIVGLLIIVILVTTIILLVIVFGAKNNTTPKTTQQVKDMQIATLMFPTMLETTTECGRTIRDLLGDCAYATEIICDGKSSCEYVNETIQEIITNTLDVYGYDYAIRIFKPNQPPENDLVRIEKDGCGPGRNSIQKTNPFPTQFDFQTVIWSIKLCQAKK